MSVRDYIDDKNDFKVTAEIDTTTVMRQLALKLQDIEKPDCMRACGYIMLKYFNQFVPKKTGALRRSGKVIAEWKTTSITWGNDKVPYAMDQWFGLVYGPNVPCFDENGAHIGWIKERPQKFMKRFMGEHPGTYTVHKGPNKGLEYRVTGYTTPGTGRDWIKVGKKDPRYRQVRLNITRALKRHWERKASEYYG